MKNVNMLTLKVGDKFYFNNRPDLCTVVEASQVFGSLFVYSCEYMGRPKANYKMNSVDFMVNKLK